MSTILKALKRVDDERKAEAAPKTLEEQVLSGASHKPREPDGSRNKWLFAVAGVGVGVLGGVGYWIAQREPEPPPVAAASPAPESVVTRAPEAMAQAVAAARPWQMPRQGAPVAGNELDANVREQLRPEVTREDGLPGALGSALPAAGNQPEPGVSAEIPPETRIEEQRARADALRRLAQRRTAPAEPQATPEPARPSQAPSAPPEAPADGGAAFAAKAEPERSAAPAPAREVEPASSPMRPALFVERTQWHPAPEKRSAWVRASGAASELREGDVIEGARVREIRPSSVSFEQAGEAWKRGVGER
jgi:hypothetical protein